MHSRLPGVAYGILQGTEYSGVREGVDRRKNVFPTVLELSTAENTGYFAAREASKPYITRRRTLLHPRIRSVLGTFLFNHDQCSIAPTDTHRTAYLENYDNKG